MDDARAFGRSILLHVVPVVHSVPRLPGKSGRGALLRHFVARGRQEIAAVGGGIISTTYTTSSRLGSLLNCRRWRNKPTYVVRSIILKNTALL